MADTRNFQEMIEAQWARENFACVGLDSSYEKIPMLARRRDAHDTILGFNTAIIDATKDLVCAYKINSAFYEVHLDVGWRVIRSTIAHIRVVAPDVPVILDSKRADIGNSNQEYARTAFEYLLADAVTVNPYLGGDALQEFFAHSDKGIFVLCRTSNPGAEEIQKLILNTGEPLYHHIAKKTADSWNANKNCGLVVGATCADELRDVRAVVGSMPILVPGIGMQGGDGGGCRNGQQKLRPHHSCIPHDHICFQWIRLWRSRQT